ncbi:MAG: hypothetical protein QOJ65_2122 [Fimbriimonadaceae bacterium]|nr:hypothetical protein [Fimbriimonadaceae bacterium]
MASGIDDLSVAAEVELEASSGKKGLLSQSLANMALRGTSMVARFLLMIGLAHYLAPTDVGVFGLMYASTTLGTLLLGLRFDVYSTRALCSGKLDNPASIIRNQMVFHLLVYVLVLPLMVLLVGRRLPLGWFYALLILEHAGQECNRLFIALAQPLRANFVFFVRSGLWAVAFIALMVASPGYRNLQTLWLLWAVGGVGSLLLSAVWMRSLGWRKAFRERVDWAWIKRGLKPSAAFTMAVGAATVLSTVDRYFLDFWRGTAHVGVYSFFSSLTNFVPTFAETGVVSILLPALIGSAAAKDRVAYEATMRKMSRGVWGLVGITVLLSVAIAPLVLMIVRKSPIYGEYLPAFGILLAAAAVVTLSFIPHNALYAHHRDRDIAKWSVVAMVIGLICYAALTPPLGIYGVCFGGLVASVVLWAGKSWAAKGLAF